MAHDNIWDAAFEASPADTDAANTLGVRDRETKKNIRQRMDLGFEWDDINDGGKAVALPFLRQGSDPTTPSGTDLAIYTKQLGTGPSRLHVKDHVGTVYPINTQRVFNVKDYGAVGDGVALESTAIQAALDAANTATGGTVHFPPGTYLINATLTLYSKVALIGDTSRSAVLKANAALDATMLSAVNRFGVLIWGLEIDGNRASQSAGRGIVFTTTATDVVIENCYIHDTYDDAIDSANSAVRFRVANCHLKDIGQHGIEIVDASSNNDVVISNVTIDSVSRTAAVSGKRAIKVGGVCVISNVSIFNLNENAKTSGGVELNVPAAGPAQHGKRCTISGLSIQGTGDDVVALLIGGQQCAITGVAIVLTGASAVGVRLQGASAVLRASKNVLGDIRVESASIGYDLQQESENNLLNGVQAFACAIGVREDGQNNRLYGVDIWNPTTGISVLANSDNLNVAGGSIKGSAVTNGILLDVLASGALLSDIDFSGTITNHVNGTGVGTKWRGLHGVPVPTVAIAGTITLPVGAECVVLSGSGTVNTINGNTRPGAKLMLAAGFGALVVGTAGNIVFATGTAQVENGAILFYDGAAWRSLSRI